METAILKLRVSKRKTKREIPEPRLVFCMNRALKNIKQSKTTNL